jgi:electron transfer flavoprotein alpha subunit
MAEGVLAIAEQMDGVFKKAAIEAVSEGKRIAKNLGTTLTALVMGSNIEEMAKELAEYGADRIVIADNPLLKDFWWTCTQIRRLRLWMLNNLP